MTRTARQPIIAVMGHIDHGKSSLLDYIRKTNVTSGEAGGITQHVSAYEAEHEYDGVVRKMTFLDTPGHEAFHALRARGATAADIAILVIAADEGVKPQTLDALNAIKEAEIPYIVAFTKIDKKEADVERAKTSLIEHEIYLEGLGGSIPYTPVSSKNGEGVDALLDLTILTADMSEIFSDASLPAAGFVLESTQEPKLGMSATLIVKDGTLKIGTFVVAGNTFAPVRFMDNFAGKRVKEATPSMPVVVTGFSELPPAGTLFSTVSTKKEAQALVVKNESENKKEQIDAVVRGMTTLPIILKADVTGSIEAIKHELSKVTHEAAVLRIINTGIGSVSEGDVKTASAAGGIVVAFNVSVDSSARDLADRAEVSIESFSIIYDLENRVAELLKERAPHITKEKDVGEAKIIKIFGSTARKQVAGARLSSGTFSVDATVRILRREIDLGRGKVTNLQQARANVKDIKTDGEFGIEIETRVEIAPGDVITSFITVDV